MRAGAGVVSVAVAALVASPLWAGEAASLARPEGVVAKSPAADEGPRVEDFAWMAGHWRGEGLGGICEEMWTGPLGGSMVGLFRLIRDGELVFSEHLMLARERDGIVLKVKHFSPEFVAWEEKADAIRFRLETLRANEAIFKGMRIRRTAEGLEFVIRFKSDSGESREETIVMRPHS